MDRIIEKEPIAESNGCSVYRFKNESGGGTIMMYDVFPGVRIAFDDFHMSYYDSRFQAKSDLFCIDHCREGRMECLSKDNAYSYVEAGDIKLDRRLTHRGRFEMPLSHYHGATVAVDMKIAIESLPLEIKDFPVDLRELQQKFCSNIYPTIIHRLYSIEHIFGEIYNVPEKIKIPYFKIKILELFLYLDALEIPKEPDEKPYFYKTQVEKVKAIKQFIENNIHENYTQEDLSKQFDIPINAMKRCFRSIYGMPIGGWILQYRMNYAAEVLLGDSSVNITELAGSLGYDSPSKFSMAFRRTMGMSPTEYRSRKTVQSGHNVPHGTEIYDMNAIII